MPKDMTATGEVLSANGQSTLMLPGEAFLQDAAMTRDGADLVLTLSSGETVTVEGYFAAAEKPVLLSPKGGVLSPELVESFLAPAHAGEYAQSGQTANDASPAGQVTDAVGDVFILRADGTKLAAEKGMMVFQGDIVEAAVDSAVNIVFADNSSFAVSEGARLSVDKYIYDAEQKSGSSFFSMLKGAFIYTSGMIGKNDPENVNIDTPVGSIGIRGTVVAGVINEAGQLSEITVIDGAVVVSNGADSYVLDEDFETLQLTGFDSEAQNIGTVDAAYMTENYSFDNMIDGFSFDDYTAPEETQPDSLDNEEGSAPADGTVQTADAGTDAALSGDLLVQEMLQFQTYQQFQDQIGDEFIDQTGGAVLPLEETTALLSGSTSSGTSSGATGGESLLDGMASAPTAPAAPVPPPPITVTLAQWWDGSSMAAAGPGREFMNIGFEIGQITATSTGGTVSYAITGGDLGFTGLDTFDILADGTIVVTSDLGSYQQFGGFTLNVEITDTSLNVLPVNLTVSIDDISSTRNYISGSVGPDGGPLFILTPTASQDLLWGASGDDTFIVNDPSGGDIHLGGLGSDFFIVTSLTFDLIDGGYNTEAAPHPDVSAVFSNSLTGDTVQLGNVPGGLSLDLTSGPQFKGIENFVFSSNVAHSITLNTASVLYTTNQNDTTLRIWGADTNTGTPYTVNMSGEFTETTAYDGEKTIYSSTSNPAVQVAVYESASNEVNVIGIV